MTRLHRRLRLLPILAIAGLIVAGSCWAGASSCRAATPDPARPAARLQRLAKLEAPADRHAHDAVLAAGSNACLALLASDPQAASDDAVEWSKHGGGDDAAQCGALADVALGDPAAGAASLDALSQHRTTAEQRRALFADQAVQAWLLAGRPDAALASARHAVALDPADEDLLVDRGRAAVAAGDAADAVADLSHALAVHPNNTEALVARAAAYRRQERLDAARADIDTACQIEPDEPSALLERGILRERTGDADGARADWDRILAISPDTHEADLAQQDLALLEAGPEAR
ncbi:tetratricopeptide repeat protein [Lichenicola sp.]|uniref:tetratricopeptide repeat protein n=1 Tax=Lichenicola sp. TaxID=2804529 RepID=UPI003B00333C